MSEQKKPESPADDVADDASKPWYESKAVVGGLVAIASGVAAAFGVAVAPEDQEQLVSIITAIGAAAGGAAAVYGRIKASTTIK